jgi:adenylosuccinate synthase
MTDYLCAMQGAGVVVRFNGGAQAGHTVVMPDGRRHVFHHFGSGSFWGVPTFLSQFFVVNPLLFYQELDELAKIGLAPDVFAHPTCVVTTFADMIINQRMENARGSKRHGSVGVGINETHMRSQSHLKITMADIWNGPRLLKGKLEEICTKYAAFRCGSAIEDPDAMIDAFLAGCEKFANQVHPAGIGQCKDPVFEGAQGLLLDQDNKLFFPHVTRSKTGMHNVRLLCDQAGIKDIDTYYVSRTYLTRHGAGPLPGEDPTLSFADDTNVPHDYQGVIRFAPLDAKELRRRCRDDFGSGNYKLVLTHCDQWHPICDADLYSYGPTRAHVTEKKDG